MIRKKGLSGGVILLMSLLFLLFSARPSQAAVIYVTQEGAGLRNGSSWSNACGEAEFKTALDNAEAGSEIEFWVAKGTYRPSFSAGPDTPADREASFVLKSGMTLYGGFAGGETNVRQRDYRKNVTVLTGDLKGDDSANPDGVTETAAGIVGENSYTVVTSFGAAAPNTGILDGFTITGGSADWTDTNTGGAVRRKVPQYGKQGSRSQLFLPGKHRRMGRRGHLQCFEATSMPRGTAPSRGTEAAPGQPCTTCPAVLNSSATFSDNAVGRMRSIHNWQAQPRHQRSVPSRKQGGMGRRDCKRGRLQPGDHRCTFSDNTAEEIPFSISAAGP